MKSTSMSMEPKKKLVNKKLYNDKKYKEAAERNLNNAERRLRGSKHGKYSMEYIIANYKNLSLSAAKMKLGIRKTDPEFDKRIAHMLLAIPKAIIVLQKQEDSHVCRHCGKTISSYCDHGVCDLCNKDVRGELD